MPATFDGINLLITLPQAVSGVLTIDVERDLYSDWKEWALLSDNIKFPLAFRESVGGDQIQPGLDNGSYFFFQNQKGWRIKPFEGNGEYTFTGNLVAEDTTLPMMIRTTGAFTVFVNGLQPITQNVDKIMTQALTESYAANGTQPTLPQMLYMIWSALSEFSISGTTITAKKLDGTSVAMTFNMDDAANPTNRTRAT